MYQYFDPITSREKEKEPKMDKITKKFYVGANKVFDTHAYGELCGKTWAKKTEAEAIEHAKEILEKNPRQEFAFVVKVIKIVKRDRPPYKVEVVK